MSRRRLRVVYTSSDDEDDEPHQPLQHQDDEVFEEAEAESESESESEMEIPSPDSVPNIEAVTLESVIAAAAAPVVISDEGFFDVSDNLSPPSPPPEHPAPAPVTVDSSSFVSSDCPVNDCLRKMGLSLRRGWLDSCKLGLQSTVPGFASFDVDTKAKLCFGQFLSSDMNCIGAGVLPENVHQMHGVDLAGPFVLQVDEVINIICPLKERYKNAPQGIKRCLKLYMTDGVQRVFGMEYRPIPSEALQGLGPAGFKVVIQNVNVRRGLLMLVPEVFEVLGGSVEQLEAARRRLVHEINKPPRGIRSRTGVVRPLSTRATLAAWPQNGASSDPVPLNGTNPVAGNSANSTFYAGTQFHENVQGADTTSRNMQAHSTGRESTELSSMGQTNPRSTSRESAQLSIGREAAQCSTSIRTADFSGRGSAELSSFPTTAIQNEDAHMVDHVEHPFILSEGKELPFTYLASLSAKWASVQGNEPFVRGKIKCFLTGVKGFHYKQRSTFELRVYVDDGSLISEIIVHHNVVQKKIGCSPEEFSAALSSSDQKIVTDMKDTLKRFQIFLINFEGTMVMELNETSTVPVALEMNEGCPASDAWLLLQRLKPISSTNQVFQNDQSNVITLSP